MFDGKSCQTSQVKERVIVERPKHNGRPEADQTTY